MPITLSAPIQAPEIVGMEIVKFSVDLEAMTCAITMREIDVNGNKAGAVSAVLNLLDAQNQPRFTPDEYTSIKGALYRLAIEDGVVSGTIS